MGEEAKKRIAEALQAGFTKEQIAESFRKKLSDSGEVSPEEINLFLAEHNLTGTVTRESFGRQVSDAFRGFGKDVVSGAAGGLALAKAGTGPIGQTLSLGASYAGGAAGQGIEDIVRDEQPQGFGEAVGRYHQAGMKGLQDELIGGPIAKVFEKIVAPFGGKLSPQDKAVAEYAAAKKLPMAPSDIFPSRTAKMVEWIGDSLLLGKAVGDIRRKQLGRNIEKIIDNTSKDLNFLTDKGTAGATLGGAIKEARKDLKEKTGEAYSKFTSIAEALDAGMNEEIKRTGTVKKPLEMSNFIETANKWRYQIDNEKHHDLRQFLSSVGDRSGGESSGMVKEGMTGKELDIFQKQIWKHTYKNHKYIGAELWDALEKDLAEESPKVWGYLKSAKDAAVLENQFRNNPTVKAVANRIARGDIDNVIYQAFRTGNIEDLNTIKRAISSDAWNVSVDRFVQNILESSRHPETNAFMPEKFIKTYSSYSRQLHNVAPNVAENLDMLVEVMRRSIDDLKKSSGDTVGSMIRGGISGGITGSAIYSGNVGLMVPEGFATIMAYMSRSPSGVFKRFLTKGIDMPGTNKMLRLGGRFVDFNADNQPPEQLTPTMTQ